MSKYNKRYLTMSSLRTAVRRSAYAAPLLALAIASPASALDITEHFEMSGLVEVEAGFISNGEDSSDIVAATVELRFDAQISDQVTAHVQLLWEEDETELTVDEATINLALTESVSVTGGKMYVPFGRFETNMISDPLTLELAETVESVLQLGFGSGPVSGSVYVFNGDTLEADEDDKIASFGANIDFLTEIGGSELNLAASYISNIADSDALQEIGAEIDSQVAGFGLFASWTMGPFMVIAEHIMADDFTAGDFGDESFTAAAPSASNIEVAYELPNGLVLAAGYQQTDEAAQFDLPEKGYLFSVSKEVLDGATLSAEYASFDDYAGESTSRLLFQLAAEF